ncbi:DUF2059 domain-containing protein [Soonwooa sp.]|uniref:DUF2059 domain-containing protein n=1 Tax=Soonwooa sp. TaxID=1938592 RepID=UPI0028ADB9AA|nr:DUF2059 domain-containing protein [Soonwooa sp.]
MKRIVLISAILISTLSFAQTKEQKVEKLMEVTGMTKNMELMFNQVLDIYAKDHPAVPASYWTKVKEKVNYNDLIMKMSVVYIKYYTSQDLDELIKFYQTPVGKKTISTLPQIMQEGMEIGKLWGAENAARILEDLEKEGYFQAPPPPMPTTTESK